MRILVVFLFLTTFHHVLAQVPKDTSYTSTSELQKQLKKYPGIALAEPKNDEHLTVIRDVVYSINPSRSLHLDAYLNKSNPLAPAIIMLHEGGWKSGNKTVMAPLASALAGFGFHCFAIEYRLSDEAIYPAAINDVAEALDFLIANASRFSIDTTNIALIGCSSGGQIATLFGTQYDRNLKGIVNLDGILAFHHPKSQEGKLASLWLGGSFEDIPQVWKDASPLTHVSSKTPPILFINSQFERFHAGRDEMIQKMTSLAIATQVVTIENSPHTFWLFHPWFETITTHIQLFLSKLFNS